MPSSAPAVARTKDTETLSDLLVSVRRHLHRHPELGFQEHATARFIRETLERHGLTVQGPIAETGLFVDIAPLHGRSGPRVGYRADIDALPIQDAKKVPYGSQRPGVAHLCGHDAHTAIGIGVALQLHEQRANLRGTARVFFQPNEEGMPSGAPRMIEEGILDGLEAVYAIHIDPSLDAGRYGLLTGPVTAAADGFEVRIRGDGSGHSARPHEAVDTVWVTTQLMNSFYQLTGRITDARNATVLTICRLEGGEAHNVIPPEVRFSGTLRTTSTHDRRFLHERMKEIAERQGALYGAHVDVQIKLGAPPVINAPAPVRTVERSICELFGPKAVFNIPRASMGGEDFSHYLEHVPGALIRVGSASGPETRYPLHDARFDLDESILAPTARLMSEVLMTHLADR